MSYDGVRAGGDEFVAVADGEFEGEESSEGAVACGANDGGGGNEDDGEQEGRRDDDVAYGR